MEFLTLGEVLDNIKFGQVAIKIDGEYGVTPEDETQSYIDSILYLNEDNYFLYGDTGRVTGFQSPPNHRKDKYILVDREVYESIKRNILKHY